MNSFYPDLQCKTHTHIESVWDGQYMSYEILFLTLYPDTLDSFPQVHLLILISGGKKYFPLRSITKLVHSFNPRPFQNRKDLEPQNSTAYRLPS